MPCEHDGLIEDELYYYGRRGVRIRVRTSMARVRFVSFCEFLLPLRARCVEWFAVCVVADDLLRLRFIYIGKSK